MTTHIDSQRPGAPVRFGCHCDLEPGMEPDGCVLDYGKPEDCVHSKSGKVKQREKCEHWRPIAITPNAAERAQAQGQISLYREALQDAERGLHFAWQMLSAICDSDPSRDRIAARDKTLDRLQAVQRVLANEQKENAK